jgi:hypothetical protein
MKKNFLPTLSIIALLSVASTVHADNFLADMFAALLGNSPQQPATPPTPAGYLTEAQAKSYVDQIIASIVYEFNPSASDSAYLATLIRKTVLESPQTYSYSPYGKKQYKKDIIDQYINGAVIEYIETKSYNYTLQRTYDKSVARKISESMRGNAMAIINKTGTVNPADLKKFVGSSLQKAVDDYLKSIQPAPTYTSSYSTPKPSAPPAYAYPPAYSATPTPTAPPAYDYPPAYEAPPAYTPTEKEYPSKDCCVCLESFKSVDRVFLRPCGHDMCKNCIFQWFFGKEGHKTCPTCRGTVNLERLSQDLA